MIGAKFQNYLLTLPGTRWLVFRSKSLRDLIGQDGPRSYFFLFQTWHFPSTFFLDLVLPAGWYAHELSPLPY